MMLYNKKLTVLLITILVTLSSAHHSQSHAQQLGNNDTPIEISADNSLEWLQNKQQYVANGNVEVTQGTSKILCDRLVADYRENEKTGSTEIWQLTAYDNVRLTSDDNQAQGDKAIHNVDTGLSTLTGNNLKLTTPDQTITAAERLEYNMNEGLAKAIGSAKIVRGSDTLSANNITATFGKNAQGKQILKTSTATGNVKITTPDEVLTGNKAVYNAVKNTATVTGNVTVKRGPNILEGGRAEVNLATNVSKMFGTPNNGKRVKGVFFPSSKPKKEGQ